MAFDYDVFISYANQDLAFARLLVGRLRLSGFRTWFDREMMLSGSHVQEELRRGLGACRHAVFIVSKAWLARPWPQWEVHTYHDLHQREDCTLVPILRQSFLPGKIPPYLDGLVALDWPEAGADFDSCYWRLFCSLRKKEDQELGPENEWAQRGREASIGEPQGSVLPPARADDREARALAGVRWSRGRAVRDCDRDSQWLEVQSHAEASRHQALFLLGARGEGHEFFLETVSDCLPIQPPRRIRSVRWAPVLPSARPIYLDALARTLECEPSPNEIARSLKTEYLSQENLVLVHRPVAPIELEEKGLWDYYMQWLPELLPEPGTTCGFLKVVQAIHWVPKPTVRACWEPWLSWLPRQPRASPGEEEAEPVSSEINARKVAAWERWQLDFVVLPPLLPLTREHVTTWSRRSLPPDLNREEFIADVWEGASSSADVLSRIVERLCAGEE